MTKHTILFLAANPLGTDRLALDEEARAIQAAIERSGHRDKFELVTRWAAQPLDLLDELRKLKPTVVHFSGHGGRDELPSGARPNRDIVTDSGAVNGEHVQGLYFQGRDGRPQLVSTEALQNAFGSAGSSVKLIVLNACYSSVQAEALLEHVDCVVGMSGSISDDAARTFGIGFYGGLGERQSVLDAYLQGLAAVRLEGFHDGTKPQLKIRNGINARRLVLAELRDTGNAEVNATEASSTSHGPLRFAAIDIDARDPYWNVGQSERPIMFNPRALRHFHLARFYDNADPLFDITLINVSGVPVIVTTVGFQILKSAHMLNSVCRSSTPAATKVLTDDIYVLDIPRVCDSLQRYAGRHVLGEHQVAVSGEEWPLDTMTVCKRLPDPIYLEPGAPYRYSLLLRRYLDHMPYLARIRMYVATDAAECHSDEFEIFWM